LSIKAQLSLKQKGNYSIELKAINCILYYFIDKEKQGLGRTHYINAMFTIFSLLITDNFY